ncbi:MAG TPA: alpha/beta hydrolase [Pyrinomonadaceae bacterium]|nr:alpha/beta hydrolase [Pyrinomonadaceae bacterium]
MKLTLLVSALLLLALGTGVAAQPSQPTPPAPAPSTQGQPQQQPRFDPAVPRVLYRIPGQEKARVQRDVVYKRVGAAELKMDVYSPAEAQAGALLPAILFLSGASETKHWGVYTSYGELTAAQGMIAVQFNKRYEPGDAGLATAQEDITDLIAYLRQNAARFDIDRDRLCLWGFSAGGTLVSTGMLPDQPFIRCIVSYYGIGQLGPRRQVTALGDKLPPMLVVRAGLDNPILNNAIDLFILEAINKNIRVDFYNYPDGRHAFDIFDDKERTREIIRNTFQFIRQQLAVGQPQ